MKNLILLPLLICSFSLLSQDVVPDLKSYEDAGSKLYASKVIEVTGKSQKELINLFKNWASTSFASLKDVIVSETDNQIVIVYVDRIKTSIKVLLTTYPDDMSFYTRLVSEFKDGKMRVSLYDDGNVARISQGASYANPAISGRNYFVLDMIKNQEKPQSTKDYTKIKYFKYDVALKYQASCDATLISVEEGIKNPTSSAPKRKDDF
jgi:hypothetical protein